MIPDWEYPEVALRALLGKVDVTWLSGNRYALHIADPHPQAWWKANVPLICGAAQHYCIQIVPDWGLAPA